METDRIVRLGLLYDFYGSLLTEKQRSVVERYC
ncbi:MAG TPA: DNA-binding protein, partial [Firmicutes bacterium]|nr:DNA-binding protein [Bacillota bacterium]